LYAALQGIPPVFLKSVYFYGNTKSDFHPSAVSSGDTIGSPG